MADTENNRGPEVAEDGEPDNQAAQDRHAAAADDQLPPDRQQQPASGSPDQSQGASRSTAPQPGGPSLPTAGSSPERGVRASGSERNGQGDLVRLDENTPESEEEVVEGELDDPQQELVHLLAAAFSASSWSGMLPRPDDFNEYEPNVQERMMQWNDAWTTDESRRQDDLVRAEIEGAREGRRIATALAAFCFVSAVVFFALGRNLAGVALLAVPVLNAATSFLSNEVFSTDWRWERLVAGECAGRSPNGRVVA